MGHNASARHAYAYAQELLVRHDSDTEIQTMLADPQDICRLYDNWRKGTYNDMTHTTKTTKVKEARQWYTNTKYTKPETDDEVNDNMTPPKPNTKYTKPETDDEVNMTPPKPKKRER